jgi:hypothetical protein
LESRLAKLGPKLALVRPDIQHEVHTVRGKHGGDSRRTSTLDVEAEPPHGSSQSVQQSHLSQPSVATGRPGTSRQTVPYARQMQPRTAGESPTPRLSVVTPSFNFRRFLGETLDSVAGLRTSHEHIVMDGGSTDGTVELLSGRDDPALTWLSEPDRGQTHAVNKGLTRARGDYVGWLNADDAYISGEVDAAIAMLDADPNLGAVFGFMDVVDEDGRVGARYRCGRFSWTRYLYFGEYVPTPTIIFRRSLLSRAPALDERYADAADYDFYLRLLRGARVENVRRPLVRFRFHEASKTASNPQLQLREGLAIRLAQARTPLERPPMRLLFRLMSLRSSTTSPWPEMQT